MCVCAHSNVPCQCKARGALGKPSMQLWRHTTCHIDKGRHYIWSSRKQRKYNLQSHACWSAQATLWILDEQNKMDMRAKALSNTLISIMQSWQLLTSRLPHEKYCYGWLHRRLLRRYRPQSAVNCSTLWEQTTGSQPSTSQVSLEAVHVFLFTFLITTSTARFWGRQYFVFVQNCTTWHLNAATHPHLSQPNRFSPNFDPLLMCVCWSVRVLLPVFVCVCRLSVCLFVCLFVCSNVCVVVCLSPHALAWLFVCLFVCLCFVWCR